MPQDRKILSSMVPSVLRRFASSRSVPHKPGQADEATLSIPARLARAGLGARLIVEGGQSAEPDPTLIKLVLKTEALRTTLMTGGVASIEEIAKRQGVTSSYVTRLLRLAFLAPDITAAILHGRHSPELTGATLLRHSRLAFDWGRQRVMLGFA